MFSYNLLTFLLRYLIYYLINNGLHPSVAINLKLLVKIHLVNDIYHGSIVYIFAIYLARNLQIPKFLKSISNGECSLYYNFFCREDLTYQFYRFYAFTI